MEIRDAARAQKPVRQARGILVLFRIKLGRDKETLIPSSS
jgi:hypothetical protein